jgi:hypothetical protein
MLKAAMWCWTMVRIFHPWHKWECYKAGFYGTSPPLGMDKDSARAAYSVFLSDIDRFKAAMKRVSVEWPRSCEHFLTNESMNRIAWLGQSSMCIETGVPSVFRGGFMLLDPAHQFAANNAADDYLRSWINEREDKFIPESVEQAGLF